MVDYSKWDHIDISDDEGEDCHPNIDKQSWIKWKKEARQIKKKEDREAREKEDKLFQEEVKALDSLERKKEAGKEEEQERLRKSIEAYKKRRENEAKHPVLEADNLREGFSKTIINKATPTTLDQLKAESSKKEKEKEVKEPKVEKETKVEKEKEVKVKKAENTAEATSEDPEANEEEEEEENPKDAEEQRVVDEYVKQMEIKAHTFAASKTFEEYWEILKKHPDIMCSETHQYLLLHSSDFMKKEEDALSQHYLRAACIVNYCLELGKDGVTLFFHRMREANPKWRMEFERDTLAYWHRIREKYIELGKIKVDPAKEKAKAKTQAKPASIEDDLD